MAISDIEKMPFSKMSKTIIIISIFYLDLSKETEDLSKETEDLSKETEDLRQETLGSRQKTRFYALKSDYSALVPGLYIIFQTRQRQKY
jgi:hypothetical protein